MIAGHVQWTMPALTKPFYWFLFSPTSEHFPLFSHISLPDLASTKDRHLGPSWAVLPASTSPATSSNFLRWNWEWTNHSHLSMLRNTNIMLASTSNPSMVTALPATCFFSVCSKWISSYRCKIFAWSIRMARQYGLYQQTSSALVTEKASST